MSERDEELRMNRYGRAMAKAALAGFGTVWRKADGSHEVCSKAGPGMPAVLFDWANDQVIVEEAGK